MRKSALFLALAVLGLTVVAVYLLAGRVKDGESPPQRTRFPVSLVDDEGVTITVSSLPERIVVAAPHLTEFIFAIGGGPRVIGVTDAELRPPEARVLPSVIGSDGVTPDAVRIGELAPDLVIVAGFTGADWKNQLRNTGTPVATFNATGIDDAIADMKKVGDLCGADASRLLSAINKKVEAVTKKTRSRQTPRVFVESFYPPLTGVGPVGFTGELVKRAGGMLVGPAGASETFSWTLGDLSSADPDLYIAPSSTGEDVEALRSRKGFDRLRAVRVDGVHVIPDDTLFSPGPRLSENLAALANIFHPGLI